MSGQAQKVKNKNVPEWAQELYYNSGLMSEVLVFHGDEAIYFEHKGKDTLCLIRNAKDSNAFRSMVRERL